MTVAAVRPRTVIESTDAIRPRTVIGCTSEGLPRTYRLAPARRDAAYRRLAIAILRLDIDSLNRELRSARRMLPHASPPLAA